ncbi:MAG: GlsB/YeaQ/YmgE family stress response membrane protein [Bacteroidaceae bacterium]|nr:GlsB/YeaQ/YmgE family stress response membrane protein [Bacteroidaceae bacterium]
MLEHIAQFTAWPILTGIFIGYIANRIMSGEGKGCCMNLIIGIIGSYAGALLSSLLDVNLLAAGYLKNFIFCVLGAIIFLWIWKKLFD